MPLNEAVGYWIAQFLGGILGGFMLWRFVEMLTRSTTEEPERLVAGSVLEEPPLAGP